MGDGKCICGLDHSEPLPEKFDLPPIVGAWPPGEYCCHVCGAVSKATSNELFHDINFHYLGCNFAKTLKPYNKSMDADKNLSDKAT